MFYDGQASEIFGDKNHQRVETNSKVSNDDNLSYIIDVEDYASEVEYLSYDESNNSKTCDALVILDCCSDSTTEYR